MEKVKMTKEEKKKLKELKRQLQTGGFFYTIKQVKSYMEDYLKDHPSDEKMQALVKWADERNELAKEYCLWKVKERKGYLKSDKLYFVRTFKKEYTFNRIQSRMDKENKFKLEQSVKHSYVKAFLHKYTKPHAVATIAAIIASVIIFYPYVRGIIVDLLRDKRPAAEFAPADTYPNENVPKDEKGNIIEYPVLDQEAIKAYKFFEKKIIKDFKNFGIDINSLDNVIGIYENPLIHESFYESYGVQRIIEIVVSKDGKAYSLQYIHDGDVELNTNENFVRTLSSLNACLSHSYIYNAGQMTPYQKEILDLTGNSKDLYIGDYYEYRKQNGRAEYKIPVYTEETRRTYSIEENDLSSEDDIYDELKDYLNKENDYFTEDAEQTVESKYEAVIDAIGYSQQLLSDGAHYSEQEEEVSEEEKIAEYMSVLEKNYAYATGQVNSDMQSKFVFTYDYDFSKDELDKDKSKQKER